MKKMKLNVKKTKGKESFVNYVLFNKEAFNILSGMSYIAALLVCGSLTIVFFKYDVASMGIIFGVMTCFSIYNIIKYKAFQHIYKVFKGRKEEYFDLTTADMLNTVLVSKKKQKEDLEEIREEEE